MTKLEEILVKHIDKEVIKDWKDILYDNEEKDPDCLEPIYNFWITLENGIKEYAEHYAKKCLEKAAEQAVVFLPSHYGLHGTHNVDKDSILNIKLPEHD